MYAQPERNCVYHPVRIGYSLTALLVVQVAILLWISWGTAPGWDEWAHLPSGLYTLKTGDFHPYRVNPPLARLLAAIPVAVLGGSIENCDIPHSQGFRSEWFLMMKYIHQEGEDVFRWMSIARTALIPLALFGTCLVWRIASHFGGPCSGLIAAILWTFSPMLLTYGASIAPDMAATVLGLWASWRFYLWRMEQKTASAFWLGVSIAAALLSKATWILLPPIFATLFLVDCLFRHSGVNAIRASQQIALVMATSFALISTGYGWAGILQPIGEFRFISELLSGNNNGPEKGGPVVGNRFQGTLLGAVPCPLPADYTLGIDVQRRDFEMRFHSYLMGEWSDQGWWYYYFVAWFVKEPLPFWTLFAGSVFWWFVRSRTKKRMNPGVWMVVCPGLAVFVFVSSQTGFNHHLRYVLPAFPAIFIWMSIVLADVGRRGQFVIGALILWLCFSTIESLPRSYAYFNDLIGGSRSGHRFLNSSNLDWGQDLLAMKGWIKRNQDKRPVFILHPVPQLDLRRLGIDAQGGQEFVDGQGPTKSGWWLVSTEQCLREPNDWFLKQSPTKRVSVSTNVFHVVDREGAIDDVLSIDDSRK